MSIYDNPPDDAALLKGVSALLLRLEGERAAKEQELESLTGKEAELGYHPNFAAYLAGGMLLAKGFDARHVLSVAGFYALDWRDALERLGATDSQQDCRLLGMRLVCDADPLLEIAGLSLFDEMGLLKSGAIDRFWLRRAKLGLGQTAKAFGLTPCHAQGHRGLFKIPIATLYRGFTRISAGREDCRFGALLVPLIESGGERLAKIGAAAFHSDAQERYREDCRSFEEHQRRDPDRRWRWKPPLARQGHLAITTAKARNIELPALRTRGLAANWLEDHGANIRFTREDFPR